MSLIEIPSSIQLIEKQETRTSRGVLSKGWYCIEGKTFMVKETLLQKPEQQDMNHIRRQWHR